jgi:thiol-disulfide isomerase/thioredoxin
VAAAEVRSMSGFWLASYLALWALVLILAAGFVALFHHFGQMYMNTREGRASHGPEVDAVLRSMATTTVGGEALTIPVEATPTVIVVSDTTCPLCRQLQPALSEIAGELDGEAEIVVLCSGRNEQDVAAWGEDLSAMVRLVSDRRGKLAASLGIGITPFVVAVDQSGIVRGRGLVNDLIGLREAAADAAGMARRQLSTAIEVSR